MARPRKPTAELKLNGAFAKNPNRARSDPPTSGPIGEPPPSMDVKFHAIWHELISNAPLNVLRSRDRFVLELAVRVLFKIRYGEELEAAMVAQLNKCLSLMGMTPVDASKVHAPQDKPDNPFAKFASKSHGGRKSATVHVLRPKGD